MLSVLLLVIKILSVIFAPSSFDFAAMTDRNTSRGSRNPVVDTTTNESSTASDAVLPTRITTKLDLPPQPPQHLVSSELTSFTSGGSRQRLERNESVAGSVIHGNHPCVWQNYNGSLVTGDRAVVFTGHFFLFEKTLILPWNDIRRVELVDNTDIDLAKRVSSINGIIEIIVNDETVHSFLNVRSPEKVWLLLLTLHNDALLGRKASSSAALPHTPRIQRRNSDPALSRSLLSSVEHEEMNVMSTSHPSRPVVSVTTSMAESVAQATIESATGRLKLQPIPCTYIGVTGRLYAGQMAVYFTGKRYFWEHVSLTLPWSAIRQIRAKDTNEERERLTFASSVNTITITTKESAVRTDGGSGDDDETTFEFRNVDTPDKVWATLIGLLNESLRSVPPPVLELSLAPAVTSDATPEVASSNRRKSLRRMNSDPRTGSQVNFHYDEQETSKSPIHSPHKPGVLITDTSAEPSTNGARTERSAGDAWLAVASSQEYNKVYSNVVIDRQILPHCDLDEFSHLFLSDSATYSLARFLESRGDFDLQSTDWNATPGSITEPTVPIHTRVVQYMHPVNVPLAPPQARARKEQTVSRFGGSGILLATETYVDDLPMTDCFYVADRILVEPSNDGHVSSVVITMEFGISFVKSTMFKGIISRKTTSEFTALFKAMAQYMADALIGATQGTKSVPLAQEGENVATIAPKREIQARTITPAKANFSVLGQLTSLFSTPDRILLVLILLFQLWLMFEIRSAKQSLVLSIRSFGERTSNGHCFNHDRVTEGIMSMAEEESKLASTTYQ